MLIYMQKFKIEGGREHGGMSGNDSKYEETTNEEKTMLCYINCNLISS